MTDTQRLDIARDHATMSIPMCRADQSVGEVREELSNRNFDYAGDVAVCWPTTPCSASSRSSACSPPRRMLGLPM